MVSLTLYPSPIVFSKSGGGGEEKNVQIGKEKEMKIDEKKDELGERLKAHYFVPDGRK